ncbi:hypothetical protein P9112_008791 [Eukaryota sp. TZLM1-RC]
MQRLLLLLLTILVVSCADFSITEIDRTIDLRSSLAQVMLHFEIKSSSKASTHISLCVPEHASIGTITVNKENAQFDYTDHNGQRAVSIAIRSKLSSFSIDVSYVSHIKDLGSPVPEEIQQGGQQYIHLSLPTNVVQPYKVIKQTTTILASSFYELGQLTSIDVSSARITLSNTAPSSISAPLSTVVLAPYPIVTASAHRRFRIEPFIGVLVKDSVDLTNSGSLLSGGFSRLDLSRRPGDASTAMTTIEYKLAPFANPKTISYRDYIGNISTSQYVQVNEQDSRVALAPRYPLFGGWKFEFGLGYRLLGKAYNNMLLTKEARVELVPSIEGVFFEDLTVELVLPQFATVSGIHSTVNGVDCESSGKVWSHFDLVGGHAVVCKLSNVTPSTFKGDLVVKFSYSSIFMLAKPLYILGLVVFGIVIYRACIWFASLFSVKSKVKQQ